MSVQILTANRLADGLVVFLGYDGHWTVDINQARLAERSEDLEDMQQEGEISPDAVGVYLVEVTVDAVEGQARRVTPVVYKERIRAFGPSIHPAFAKQSVPGHFDPRADASGVFMNG